MARALDLYAMAKQILLQYDLERFTTSELVLLRKSISNARKEVLDYLSARTASVTWSKGYAERMLAQLEGLTAGVRKSLEMDIATGATTAGKKALRAHRDALSMGGRLAKFNSVALSSAQLRNFVTQEPFNGAVLKTWVDRTFDYELRRKISQEMLTGALRGEGYGPLLNRLSKGFDNITDREALVLTRSYVQHANVHAMKEVYNANKDILKGVQWIATLEPAGKGGGGTCLECACLDGNIYPIDEHPPCPLHALCRCILSPVTKSYDELGAFVDPKTGEALSSKEIDAVARPWVDRVNRAIGVGGRRPIKQIGFLKGDYSDFYKGLGPNLQKKIVGPGRFSMIDSGQLQFKDLVNKKTGHLYTLSELTSSLKKLPPGVPTPAAPSAVEAKEVQFSNATHQALYDDAVREYTTLFNELEKELKEAEIESWGEAAKLNTRSTRTTVMKTQFAKIAKTQRVYSKIEAKMMDDAPYLQRALISWQGDTQTAKPMVMKLLHWDMEKGAGRTFFGSSFPAEAIVTKIDDIPKAIKMIQNIYALPGSEYYTMDQLRQQYIRIRALNQVYMRKIGVDYAKEPLILYRGTDGKTGLQLKNAIEKILAGKPSRRTFFTLEDSSLAGYSTDIEVGNRWGTRLGGITIRIAVDNNTQIFLHRDLLSGLSHNYMEEFEYILVGGKRRIHITDILRKLGDDFR